MTLQQNNKTPSGCYNLVLYYDILHMQVKPFDATVFHRLLTEREGHVIDCVLTVISWHFGPHEGSGSSNVSRTLGVCGIGNGTG